MNTLEQSFRLIAISSAMSYGYGFSPKSAMLFNDILRDGVRSLQTRGEPSAKAVKKAQDDLIFLVFNLVNEAKKTGAPEIQETIVIRIKKKLCPLPPWIKAPCPK